MKKTDGVERVETSLETQTVDVYGQVEREAALEAIRKTGKTILEQ